MLTWLLELKESLALWLGLALVITLFTFKFCLTVVQKERAQALSERDAALEKLNVLSNDLNAQNAAVLKMQEESEAQAAKLKEAEKSAAAARAVYDKEANAILLTKVPTDCKAAIDWAAKQAAVISQQWSTSL
jgi:hypothetical protein